LHQDQGRRPFRAGNPQESPENQQGPSAWPLPLAAIRSNDATDDARTAVGAGVVSRDEINRAGILCTAGGFA